MLVKPIQEKLPEVSEDINLYSVLGVDTVATRQEIDAAWMDSDHDIESRLAWKLLRDQAYRSLYNDGVGVEQVYRAGFFVDGLDIEGDSLLEVNGKIPTTPVHKLRDALENSGNHEQPPIVLLTTGGFSPIHYGHISMMETAKKTLESQRRSVVGGYISPSHDAYVSQKYDGNARLSAEHRLHLCNLAVKDSDWLMVDPWEARYLPTDINFTDVMRRLKAYLTAHFDGLGIEVFYVCGTDNADFVNVLDYLDGGICVSRSSNYDKQPAAFKREKVARNMNLAFVSSMSEESDFSSTAVRNWQPQLMPTEASKVYFRWRTDQLQYDFMSPADKYPIRSYIVRDDSDFIIESLFPADDRYAISEAISTFKAGLAKALTAAFENVEEPDSRLTIVPEFHSLAEQRKYLKQLVDQEDIINLDVCTQEFGHSVDLSRRFELADAQFSPEELVSRHNSQDLMGQINAITDGEYTFVDDDVASGATLNLFMGLIPESVSIKSIKTLSSYVRSQLNGDNHHELLDMVDLRDFIIGSPAGGLMVSFRDRYTTVRAPYMQPFVALNARASIPHSTLRQFSIDCWKLNKDLFMSVPGGEELTIGGLEVGAGDIFLNLGFHPDTTLLNIAEFYYDYLVGTN